MGRRVAVYYLPSPSLPSITVVTSELLSLRYPVQFSCSYTDYRDYFSGLTSGSSVTYGGNARCFKHVSKYVTKSDTNQTNFGELPWLGQL